ncbi:MAG TPA: CPBP family intramembrane glutamic endopeptidase [Rhizomicrobium sp.]|nr:CPBP family intramembrane glutamic endopeptidase [Rhizomicrobium sp.]
MTETEPRFRLKLVPLLVTILLGAVLTLGSAIAAQILGKVLHLPSAQESVLLFLYVQHGFQFLFALIAIAVLKFWLVPADYGLHWPRGKTYILPAVLWGVVFATLVAAGGSWLDTALHLKATQEFTITRDNVWGWAAFEGLYVGPTEEIPFRALLVTYLAATMPGKLHIGRFNMNWAGIIVALLFALAHVQSFWMVSWQDALIQQLYAVTWGILYAYWLEKSQSIVAPIIAHNISDGITILFWALGIFQA